MRSLLLQGLGEGLRMPHDHPYCVEWLMSKQQRGGGRGPAYNFWEASGDVLEEAALQQRSR